MKRTLHYPISSEKDGLRVDAFLREMGYSRHMMIKLKQTASGITIDGELVKTNHLLQPGETLQIQIEETGSSETIVPRKLPLTIVYQDEDLLIVDKPPDMPVHPSMENHDNTLANALAYHYAVRGEAFTCRFISRLDRDTSGLLIVGRHMLSTGILSAHLKERKIKRTYLAIAKGEVPESGTIDAPIGRTPGSIISRCIDFKEGDQAITHYQRLAYKNGYSLVSLSLETGRTHQIRVHMSHIGHPLPGDYLYHPDYQQIGRQALHSWKLAFPHPISGEEMDFTSALPADMAKLID